MTYRSPLLNTLPVPIADDFTAPPDDGSSGRGRIPRDWSLSPYGQTPRCGAFTIPVIPRADWPARIKLQEESQSDLHSLAQAAGYKVPSQGQTNYCWINAPTRAAELLQLVQTGSVTMLSAASVGAKIKNFRNVGGWGTEGLAYGVEHGWVTAATWPNSAIDRKYDTAAANAERAHYQVDEWWDLKPGNFDQLATCLLLNIPVAAGYNWMSHEVLCVKLLANGDGSFSVLWYNTGYLRDANGFTVASERKATPDDAVAPRTVTGS